MNLQTVLIAHNRLAVPVGTSVSCDTAAVGTLLSNFAHYGFTPSLATLARVKTLSLDRMTVWWSDIKPILAELSGANREMEKFVVYKNFPKEVLEMDVAEYWVAQILMYLGAPNEWFTEPVELRPVLNEKLKLKVLDLARDDEYDHIFTELVKAKARWSDRQLDEAKFLIGRRELETLSYDLSSFGFKENGINLIKHTLNMQSVKWTINDATDILRLAAAMSDVEDLSLRKDVKLRNFKRSERKALLYLLEHTKNLESDMAMRPHLWKYLLVALRPGDYKFEQVKAAYHALYNDEIKTFNSQVEQLILLGDHKALQLLASRPGEFVRRFYKLATVYGEDAVDRLMSIAEKLTTFQLVKLQKYLITVSLRTYFIYRPKGSWNKSKIEGNTHKLNESVRLSALKVIEMALEARLKEQFPEGVQLSLDTHDVKLATNDAKLASYGAGTRFRIPKEMTFLRTASYWACKTPGNTWFDVGWNFFDENWKSVGTCNWNNTSFSSNGRGNRYGLYADSAAIFSGDPTNTKDMKGRACQMIDLYLDKLVTAGVRYALWNVLCYSNIPFSEAEDVLATLQWGEKPTEGKLYEPARAQMVFPLKSNAKTSYVAYLDLKTRELVYMDVDFGGAVNSAASNGAMLAEKMPAYLEYLDTLPSVADLFVNAPSGSVPILYTDEGLDLPKGEKAYVFMPKNANNSFEPLKIEDYL